MVRSRLKALPHRDCSDLQTKPAGCYRYQHGARGRRCELCPRLKEGVNFRSNFTGQSYRIICKCAKQYTGKSINYMHTRHGGHRQEIENQSSELGIHFANCGLDNLELQIIDCVQELMDMALVQLKGVGQNCLATFQVNGHINIRNKMKIGQEPNLFFGN